MSTRYVFPELFHVTTQTIVSGDKSHSALRWILHPSLGLPRAVFQVWRFGGTLAPKKVAFTSKVYGISDHVMAWGGGASAAVLLTVDVSAGTATFDAYSAGSGAGHLVDEKTVTGPVTGVNVVLYGCPVGSVVIKGSAVIQSVSILPVNDFVNDPGWKLVETVGLPVSSPDYNGTGYPLDKQGPVGAETDPVEAAIARVKNGSPDAGWPTTTDIGTSVPSFIRPDPVMLVKKEVAQVVQSLAQLLRDVANPAEQADHEVTIVTTAPKTIHGVPAPQVWQERAKPATVKPLASLLVSAGLDAYAALALGFGTTLDTTPPPAGVARLAAAASQNNPSGAFMITVKHQVTLKLKLGSFNATFPFVINGEMAAFCFRQKSISPAVPAGLAALAPAGSSRLDPPQTTDGPWLQTVRLSWLRPVTQLAWMARPTGFAIAGQMPGQPMTMKIQQRVSGGWTPFAPALSGDNANASVTFSDQGVPEPMPGTAPGLVYAVAAQDWFGRWSAWTSTDYTRVIIAPQIPAPLKVDLSVQDSTLPQRQASAIVEFSWDWSNRRPATITLRVLVYEEGSAIPTVPASVYAVGGPASPDMVIDFHTATIDTPPTGVTLIAAESDDTVKKYSATINGINLDYAVHQKTKVTVRMQAVERFDPTRPSQWSRDISTAVVSPVPPPAPFVPSPMWWSSVPDPKGISRTTISWAHTADRYTIYLADETALARELDLPSPDLEIAPADRLPQLRAADITKARRAFRRIADRLTESSLRVDLPRGSRLIYFYGIVPIGANGVEAPLPAQANSYFAVAASSINTPEVPVLIVRQRNGVISLSVDASENRFPVTRVDVFCTSRKYNAVSAEHMGSPIFTLNEATGVRNGKTISWTVTDGNVYAPWQSVFYRAVAYGKADPLHGEFEGRSLPSGTAELVPMSASLPALVDVQVTDDSNWPAYKLVSFASDVTLAKTSLGAHSFTVKTYDQALQFKSRSISADLLPLIGATLPTPDEQKETVFRYDAANPRAGRNYAWIPNDTSTVIVEVTDPSGKTSRETKKI